MPGVMAFDARKNRMLKMHGLGNDFVVLDDRFEAVDLPSAAAVRSLADRHRGIGCDTVVSIRPSTDAFDAELWFFNSDGSPASACGNATRCVAKLLLAETEGDSVTLAAVDQAAVAAGRPGAAFRALPCRRGAGGAYSVNMGQPEFGWQSIPLARAVDTAALPLAGAPAAVAMPNPHCVFFVPDADAVDLSRVGPEIEHDPLFPDRTNVEYVSLIGPDRLRMRVWERGGMVTLACGSGACAAVAAAHRRGLVGRRATVELDGGALEIDWRDDGLWMTGPASHVAEIALAPEFWARQT